MNWGKRQRMCERDEWNSQLMSDTCPEITLDNVLATFRHLNASKMQTFEQGLIDVYRKLSWDYRTNNPCRLGKKIIIENLLYRVARHYGAHVPALFYAQYGCPVHAQNTRYPVQIRA